jgi:hypothetical protein
MTEYNLFCYSEKYNDENSFQQKRYRAFNKEVGEDRYCEILKEVKEILKDFRPILEDNSWSEEWGKITQDQWQKLLSIPEAKDFKDGFEYISDCKIDNQIEELTLSEVCKRLGKTTKIIK